MSDRPPPFTALRAFEAAARHMSFAKAADELNVTPAALSYQIKSLEQHLGQPVFRRLNRAVELTEAGQRLEPGIRDGFASLQAAWRAARRMADDTTLTITAGPAFTAKWLSPRLFQFANDHPQIEPRFAATLRLLDFDRDNIDIAIRFGVGEDTALFSRPLMDEWLTPMMTPQMAARFPEPSDLAKATLLHQDDIAFLKPAADWGEWFRVAKLGAAPRGGPRFSQADHAIDAALAGAGVVLGRISLAEGALRDGLLVAPYPIALTTEAHYRLVCPEGAETRPKIRAFLDWVSSETGTIKQFEAGRIFIPAGQEI